MFSTLVLCMDSCGEKILNFKWAHVEDLCTFCSIFRIYWCGRGYLPSCLSMDESGHVEWLASWEENTPVHWIVNSFNMIRLFRYGDFAFTWTNQLQPYYSCLFCTTNTHYTLYQNVCRKCLLVFYKKEDLILLELWKWHLDSVDDQFVVRIRLCSLLELKIKAEVNGTKHK